MKRDFDVVVVVEVVVGVGKVKEIFVIYWLDMIWRFYLMLLRDIIVGVYIYVIRVLGWEEYLLVLFIEYLLSSYCFIVEF